MKKILFCYGNYQNVNGSLWGFPIGKWYDDSENFPDMGMMLVEIYQISGKYVFDGHSACLRTKLQNESKMWVFAYRFLIFPIRKFLKV